MRHVLLASVLGIYVPFSGCGGRHQDIGQPQPLADREPQQSVQTFAPRHFGAAPALPEQGQVNVDGAIAAVQEDPMLYHRQPGDNTLLSTDITHRRLLIVGEQKRRAARPIDREKVAATDQVRWRDPKPPIEVIDAAASASRDDKAD